MHRHERLEPCERVSEREEEQMNVAGLHAGDPRQRPKHRHVIGVGLYVLVIESLYR